MPIDPPVPAASDQYWMRVQHLPSTCVFVGQIESDLQTEAQRDVGIQAVVDRFANDPDWHILTATKKYENWSTVHPTGSAP
jgi:hypothetical protein